MEFTPVMTNKERKARKARETEVDESAQANKGFDVYVINKFIGNFPSIDECRKGVINKLGLGNGNEYLAYHVHGVHIYNKNFF